MATAAVGAVLQLFPRQFNQSDDPRTGSARNNATATSALRSPTQAVNSASLSTLFWTLLPILVYALICLSIFLILRPRYDRVYAPRTFLSSLDPHERTQRLPSGVFKWMKAFYQLPDTEALNRSSLDGYLFLRYLKLLCVICIFGILLTWPILIPLAAYGRNGNQELDRITFGNISDITICYVHAALAWIFFGFILYLVSRESVYFINLRQAYLFSPYYASRLSSRTVLFSCVPQQVLEERKLRRIFGDTVKNVWIPREVEELDELVEEREQAATRLEKAEISLIKMANVSYRAAVRHGHPDIEVPLETEAPGEDCKESDLEDPKKAEIIVQPKGDSSSMSPMSASTLGPASETIRSDGTPMMKTCYGWAGPPSDVSGSVAAQWIPASQRPIHRPLANYGRRTDTIKWTRNRLKELGPKIAKLRNIYRKRGGKVIPAVFIEFHSQVDAQAAFQTLAHHRPNHMVPDIIGLRPDEIVWPSLSLRWWERIIRRFAIQAFVAALVIFFAIPAAIVGTISNIEYLTKTVRFLGFINKIPKPVLSLIKGLLPAVALAMLMSIVPTIMRFCACQAGVTTKSKIELFVQNSYFLFQVVQVFLITTITSAASAALDSIIKDPLSARDILSQNLPKASNFYISYFMLQGLAMSATRIVHLGGLVRYQLMRNAGDNPRLIAKRYHRLRRIHWGSVYPVFTNMGVIAISYSLIAPAILGFALVGLYLIYLSYRYNILFIYSSERDTRGLHYPRALKHTLTGVYLAEICMFGLFTIKAAYIPTVLIVALIIFTVLVQISLTDSLSPLLFNLPRTLAAGEELRKAGNHPWNVDNLEDKDDIIEPIDAENQLNAGYDSDFDPSDPAGTTVAHTEQSDRGIDGAGAFTNLGRSTVSSYIRKKYTSSPIPSFISTIDFWTYWVSPPLSSKPNFIIKFLHPEIFADHHILRRLIPEDIANLEHTYEHDILKDAYSPKSMRERSPRLWIPKDAAGVSAQEVSHSGKMVELSDVGAWLDEKGSVVVDLEGESEKWFLQKHERVRF